MEDKKTRHRRQKTEWARKDRANKRKKKEDMELVSSSDAEGICVTVGHPF